MVISCYWLDEHLYAYYWPGKHISRFVFLKRFRVYVCLDVTAAGPACCPQCHVVVARARDLPRHIRAKHPHSETPDATAQAQSPSENTVPETIPEEIHVQEGFESPNNGPTLSTSFTELLAYDTDVIWPSTSGAALCRSVTVPLGPQDKMIAGNEEKPAKVAEQATGEMEVAQDGGKIPPQESGNAPSALEVVSPATPPNPGGSLQNLDYPATAHLSQNEWAALYLAKRHPDLDQREYGRQMLTAGSSPAEIRELMQHYAYYREVLRDVMSDLIIWRAEHFRRSHDETEADSWLRMAVLKYATANNHPPF